jgi:hypothetical protein
MLSSFRKTIFGTSELGPFAVLLDDRREAFGTEFLDLPVRGALHPEHPLPSCVWPVGLFSCRSFAEPFAFAFVGSFVAVVVGLSVSLILPVHSRVLLLKVIQ